MKMGVRWFLGLFTTVSAFANADGDVAAAIELLESKGYTVIAPSAQPTGADSLPVRTLTMAEIEREPDYWPLEVQLLETIRFVGGQMAPAGAILEVRNIAGGNAQVSYNNLLFDVGPQDTDLIKRASAIASGTSDFKGRLPTLLAGRADVLVGGSMRKARVDELAGADVYVLYMGSSACGWCARFLPTLESELARLKGQYPGKVKFIHSSIQVPYNDYRGYLRKLGADAGLPPGDQYFFEALMAELNVTRISVPQPSVILMNASGKVLAHASRNNSDMSQLEHLLKRRLSGFLANPDAIRPKWMQVREG